MPQTEERRRALLEKANTLPLCPGVYIMRDTTKKVIYVGKSRKLKNRVSQYFQKSEKDVKTSRMVFFVEDFDYILCDNEMEALSLENTLIKQYTPKYNILLKDAKSYPYLKLTAEEYPRLVFCRKRENDGAKYFGPYSGGGHAYALLELLNTTLKLPDCKRKFPRDIGKGRPCLNYQMHRCAGLCTGDVSKEDYQKQIRYAAEILGGKSRKIEREIEEEMYRHSDEERYEAAALCRDTLQALRAISQKQKVVSAPGTYRDVISLYSDDSGSCISAFFVRDGVLQDKSDFLFGANHILEAENLPAFLVELYKQRDMIPKEILLSQKAEDEDEVLLTEVLSEIAGHKVRVFTPQKGELRTLCNLVDKNAAEQAKLYQIKSEHSEDVLFRLADLLRLETYPSRIEAYDISNFGKEHLTAGMIVAKEGKLQKSDYRSFKIKTVQGTTDDYASMREALSRRVAHLSDEEGSFSETPDLILLDGGRGQVSTVRTLFAELGIAIPVFGMVKDDSHRTRAIVSDTEEFSIAGDQAVFRFVYRLQEEVHRFTIGKMESAKRKTLRVSSLTEVPGIGPAKAKALLFHFGGMGAIKSASREELTAAKGIGEKDAKAIYDYLHKEGETP